MFRHHQPILLWIAVLFLTTPLAQQAAAQQKSVQSSADQSVPVTALSKPVELLPNPLDPNAPLPLLQPGLVAVGDSVQMFPTGLDLSPQIAAAPLPSLVPPSLPTPPMPQTQTPPASSPPNAAIATAPSPTVAPVTAIAPVNPSAMGSPTVSLPTFWPESATLLARLLELGEVPATVRQLLMTNACRGCNLRGVNLQNAMLMNADLTGADLGQAILREADLRGSKLNGANLAGANLSGAIMPNGLLHP